MLPESGDRMKPACRRRPGSICGLASGARRVSSRAVARTPRGCISRDTPLRRVACWIGPKCQDEGVMISISPETGAMLPGAMGSLPIAEALRGVTRRASGRADCHRMRSGAMVPGSALAKSRIGPRSPCDSLTISGGFDRSIIAIAACWSLGPRTRSASGSPAPSGSASG
jgi:hypothetical protein